MKIILRPITEQDGKYIVKWRNSEKVKNHCMIRTVITEESNRKFYKEFVATGKYKQFIVERVDEQFSLASYPIATVYLKDMDYCNRRCELCVFTSDDSEWLSDGQSLAVKMLLEKAFNEYGMHKVYSYVFYKYAEEVELLKLAGFSVETILKEEALNEEGEYEDIVRMSIFNKE